MTLDNKLKNMREKTYQKSIERLSVGIISLVGATVGAATVYKTLPFFITQSANDTAGPSHVIAASSFFLLTSCALYFIPAGIKYMINYRSIEPLPFAKSQQDYLDRGYGDSQVHSYNEYCKKS